MVMFLGGIVLLIFGSYAVYWLLKRIVVVLGCALLAVLGLRLLFGLRRGGQR